MIDGQSRLLTKVARLYHERGARQADIADALNLSQAKVSRLLRKAAEVGIVRTTVMIPPAVYTDLEEALETAYELNNVIVIDVDPDASEDELLASLGTGAASYLENILSGNARIGISTWSQTLRAVVQRLRPFTSPGAVEVVQLLGGIGSPAMQSHAHRLLEDFSRTLGAEPIYVQAPGIVESATIRDSLFNDPSLADVALLWKNLTMTIMGIGRIEPSNVLAKSGNAFSPATRARLLEAGAEGDICHRVFRSDGTAVEGDIDQRVIAIPTEDLFAVPHRIGIAGGEEKVPAILGALRGGWVNTLITDLNTARLLLNS